MKIWAALHGVVMLAEQGLLTGQVGGVSREELVEDIVQEAKLALSVAIEGGERAERGRVRQRSLFRRPRIDRRGAAHAQNILQHLGAGEQLCLAARRRHHLQADRQARAVKPQGIDSAGQHTSVIA